MPNKDPSFLQILYLAIAESETIQGAAMAFFIAALRVIYDDKKTRPVRVLLEALICGALSLSVASIIDYFELPSKAAITVGGAIGFIGVNALREFILRTINKRVN